MNQKQKTKLWMLMDDLYEEIPKSKRGLPKVSNALREGLRLLTSPRPEHAPSLATETRSRTRVVSGKAGAHG